MDINIQPEIDQEIRKVMETLSEMYSEFSVSDDHYFEVLTPFLINPDSRNEEWKNKIGLVFYPELLSYANQTTPWICVRFELEGYDNEFSRDLCKWIVEKFKQAGYPPFMDEDSTWNYFQREETKGYTKYKMFINPSYPKGYWENHAL
jgi:hypothetical protein